MVKRRDTISLVKVGLRMMYIIQQSCRYAQKKEIRVLLSIDGLYHQLFRQISSSTNIFPIQRSCSMSITYNYIIITDIDECKDPSLHLCTGQNSKCVNHPGNYSCKCAPGYEGDGIDCKQTSHKQCKQFLQKAQRRKVQSILFLQTLAKKLEFHEIKAKDIYFGKKVRYRDKS